MNKEDITLIQLNQYIRPKIEENASKDWVLNGKDNSFYQYIIGRYNGSATNSAVINSYIDLMYGNGLYAKNAKDNITDWLRFKTIMKDSDVRKIISDYVMFNEFSYQVIKTKDGKDLGSIKHLPKERIAPQKENDEEEIERYYYCKDWKNTNKYTPMPFSAFGFGKDSIQIYNGRPYKAGKTYFSDPDYLAGLPYCELEEEIANFYINCIRKGLSAGYIINIPDGKSYTTEEKKEFERKIKEKLTGSPNALSFVLSFNGRDAEITITPFPVNEQMHKQWEYLTSESRQQIMTSHRVVSPMLFGIKDATGFGNNADELDTAEAQLIKRVIQPKQKFLIEAFKEVLSAYGISLDLYFRPLTEVQAPVTLSVEKSPLDMFIELGEVEDLTNYELIECKPVDYEEEDAIKLASTGTANPLRKSLYDTDFYLTRYRYAGNAFPQRRFCQQMMAANKIYRREDIDAMADVVVNPGFGMHPNPNNPYSIWKFKGGGLLSSEHPGGTCKHYWEKLTYRIKDVKIDPKSPIAIDEAKKDRASGIAGQTPNSI